MTIYLPGSITGNGGTEGKAEGTRRCSLPDRSFHACLSLMVAILKSAQQHILQPKKVARNREYMEYVVSKMEEHCREPKYIHKVMAKGRVAI